MEEDIKLIEAMIKEYKTFGDLHNPDFEDTDRIYEAVENIINRNRYLETKAAAEINNEINNIKVEIFKNYIPISLIEEELKELDKKEQELQNSISDEEREEYSDANISFGLMDIEIRRSVLQELLEKRK